MKQELTLSQKEKARQVPCFFCKKQVYLVGTKLWNLDGSEHIHPKGEKRADSSTNSNNKGWSDKQRKAYWANKNRQQKYGYEYNYSKYSDEEYKERRKQAEQQREQYRQRYSNQSMTIEKAFEHLDIFDINLNLSKKEIFQIVKLAYRTIALRFHPDRNATTQKFNESVKRCLKCVGKVTEKFIRSTEAYELLEQKYGGLN